MKATGTPDRVRDRRIDMETIVDHLSVCLLIIQHHESLALRGSLEKALSAALEETHPHGDQSLH